jgi:5-methylcytosine-specific restriction protein A
MEKRTPLNQRQKALLLEKQGGLCAVSNCRVKLDGGRFEDDHWTPLHLGGTNELSNRRLICVPCHKAKTIAENKLNAKAKRIRFGRTRKGPPMPGSRKSRLKKHMDGSVSER